MPVQFLSLAGSEVFAAAAQTRNANSVLHLFKSAFVPNPGSTLTDLTANECDFDGYASITLVTWENPVRPWPLEYTLLNSPMSDFARSLSPFKKPGKISSRAAIKPPSRPPLACRARMDRAIARPKRRTRRDRHGGWWRRFPSGGSLPTGAKRTNRELCQAAGTRDLTKKGLAGGLKSATSGVSFGWRLRAIEKPR